MNRNLAIYCAMLLYILTLSLAACAPIENLQGAAGQETDTAEETSIKQPTVDPVIDNTNSPTISFYLPTLVIVQSDNTGKYSTGLSTPPIDTAQYQLISPKLMALGSEQTIKLTIVPDSLQIEKNETLNEFEKESTQVFQGNLDLYPLMSADLITGNAFSIKSSISSKQIINVNNAIIWLWYITPLQEGQHRVAVNISVPVNADGQENQYEIEHIELEVQVQGQKPTPIPTPTNIPFGTQLQGNAVQVTLTIIGGIFTIFATVIGAIITNDRKVRKKRETEKAIEDKKKEEKEKIIKSSLPTSKKK